jgi:hypothetical protein
MRSTNWRRRGIQNCRRFLSFTTNASIKKAMAKKRKKHGHFCWCCGRMRPNERFSGSGHARHVCRDCSKLGSSELQCRQELRNLEMLVCGGDIIGRKQRKAFNRFFEHPDPRIRRYAEELAARDMEARVLLRFLEEEGNCEPEDAGFEFESTAVGASPEDVCIQDEINGVDDDDIPF